MIEVTPDLSLDENEIQFEFIRATGPGGQKVNKVATAVQLRFDVHQSPSLPDDVRARLIGLARNRINEAGVLVINARRFRTQARNRQDAIDRLVNLIRSADEKPKLRKKTRPTFSSKQRRLRAKRRRAEIKRLRRTPRTYED